MPYPGLAPGVGTLTYYVGGGVLAFNKNLQYLCCFLRSISGSKEYVEGSISSPSPLIFDLSWAMCITYLRPVSC